MRRLVLIMLAACSAPPRAPQTRKPASAVVEATEAAMSSEPDTSDAALKLLQSFPSGIDLLESDNSAMHEHGGEAAKIHDVRLVFEVHDRAAHEIEAKRVEMLRRHCMEKDWHSRTPLVIDAQVVKYGDHRDRYAPRGPARLVIPAGEPRRYIVSIRFAGVDAYQACDAFGFAIDLVVDRVRHTFEIPLDITRIDAVEL